MEHRIITISRCFGSGGRELGVELADRLGLEWFDQRLIALAAQSGNLDLEGLKLFDEHRESPWLYEGSRYISRGDHRPMAQFRLQSKVVRQIAREKDSLFVGPCAGFLLKSQPGIRLLTIFITAPLESRVRRKMELEGWSRRWAEARVARADRQRKLYCQLHTGQEWGSPQSYDLYLDRGQYSKEDILRQIISAYERL